ncbi:pentapeptide repeat-containing protein [Streptomyces sp. NBC_00433]
MFRNAKIFATAFADCRMVGADFQFTEMHNVRFVNCDLTGAQFGNVKMGTVRAGLACEEPARV